MKKLFLLFAVLLYSAIHAQGFTEHWLPPMFTDEEETSATTGNVRVTGINDQHISVSTLSATPITVRLDCPSDAGFVAQNVSISLNNPGKFIVPAYSKKYLTPDYINLMSPVNMGLRLTNITNTTTKFMVNTRLVNHKYRDNVLPSPDVPFYSSAEMLTSKGSNALGRDFYSVNTPSMWGATRTVNRDQDVYRRSFCTSIMATQPGTTTVTIAQTTRNMVVRFFSNIGPAYSPDLTIPAGGLSFNLTQGQSVILAGETDLVDNSNTSNGAGGCTTVGDNHLGNKTGFVGTRITATQDVAVLNGNWNGQVKNYDESDIYMDITVPTNKLDTNHAIVKGNAPATDDSGNVLDLDNVLVVATQNNTEVFLNGSAAPYNMNVNGAGLNTMMNAGDFALIPQSQFNAVANAHQNMFVRTSLPAYVYNIAMASTSDITNQVPNSNICPSPPLSTIRTPRTARTGSMSLVPPLSCFTPKTSGQIADMDVIRTYQYTNYQSVPNASSATGQNIFPNSLDRVVNGTAPISNMAFPSTNTQNANLNALPFATRLNIITLEGSTVSYELNGVVTNLPIANQTYITGSNASGNRWVSYQVILPANASTNISRNLTVTSTSAVFTSLVGVDTVEGTAGFHANFAEYLTKPIITIIPTSGCIPNVTLQVSQDCDTYQWYKDGVAIPLATNKTYTPANTVPVASGNYHAVVTINSPSCTYTIPSVYINACETATLAALPVCQGESLNIPIVPQKIAGTPTYALTYPSAALTNPVKGVVSISSAGVMTYTPNSGALGADSFTYRLCNNKNATSVDCETVTQNITINPKPTMTISQPTAVCTNPSTGMATYDLTSTFTAVSGVTYRYYTGPGKTGEITTSPSPNAYPINSARTVYVYATVTATGCESIANAITLPFNPVLPYTPSAVTQVCTAPNGTATYDLRTTQPAGAPATQTYAYSLNASMSPALSAAQVSAYAVSTPTVIYTQATNSGCLSAITQFTLTPQSVLPYTPGTVADVCTDPSGSATFNLTTTEPSPSVLGQTYVYSTSSTMVPAIIATNLTSYAVSSPTTIYVQATNNGCKSAITQFTLTPKAIPTYTPATTKLEVCRDAAGNASFDLTSTQDNALNYNYKYYSTKGNLSSQIASPYVINTTGATTVYVVATEKTSSNGVLCSTDFVAINLVSHDAAKIISTKTLHDECVAQGDVINVPLTVFGLSVDPSTGNEPKSIKYYDGATQITGSVAFTGSNAVQTKVIRAEISNDNFTTCTSSINLTININPKPTVVITQPAAQCLNSAGTYTFNLNNYVNAQANVTYTFYKNDGVTVIPANYTVSTDEVVKAKATSTLGTQCTSVLQDINLKVSATPVIGTLATSKLVNCANKVGDVVSFDFTQFGLNNNATFEYKYYSDAALTSQISTDQLTAAATSISKNIWVKMSNISNPTCFDSKILSLELNTKPAIVAQSITECDTDAQGRATYNLTAATLGYAGSATNVEYYDALGVLISNPAAHFTADKLVTVKAYNASSASCFSQVTITLQHKAFGQMLAPSNQSICDDNFDNKVTVELAYLQNLAKTLYTDVNPADPNYAVKFYQGATEVTAPVIITAPTTFIAKLVALKGCTVNERQFNFTIAIGDKIVTNNTAEKHCDDNDRNPLDGLKVIDLTKYAPSLYTKAGATPTYSYYSGLLAIQNGDPAMVDPTKYLLKQSLKDSFGALIPTVIYVVVKDNTSGLCANVAQISLTLDVPTFATNLQDQMVCPGNFAELDATHPDITGYLWSNGQTTPKIINVAPGYYYVLLTAKNGCKFTQYVNVLEYDTPVITDVRVEGRNVTITAVGADSPYQYSLDGFHYQDSNIFEGVEKGPHKVYVKSQKGCPSLPTEFVIVDLQNIFTPNEDNVNDVFDFSELIYKQNVKLDIYDRYGRQLYTRTNTDKYIWDGRYEQRILPTAAYWYTLEYQEPGTDKKVTYAGWIILKNRD
jgi:gliding motility-associated-like protein